MSALFFLAPSLIGFLLFFFVPFVGGLYYSFVDSPVGGSFVGLANYIDLLGNAVFLKAGYNTMVFTAMAVPLNILFSLGFALLLNRGIYGRNLIRMGLILMRSNILVVDDEQSIADLIEVYLENEGFIIYKFYNGQDALRCVE